MIAYMCILRIVNQSVDVALILISSEPVRACKHLIICMYISYLHKHILKQIQ